jgi:hypothetical protein
MQVLACPKGEVLEWLDDVYVPSILNRSQDDGREDWEKGIISRNVSGMGSHSGVRSRDEVGKTTANWRDDI